jgi:heme exporter protein D
MTDIVTFLWHNKRAITKLVLPSLCFTFVFSFMESKINFYVYSAVGISLNILLWILLTIIESYDLVTPVKANWLFFVFSLLIFLILLLHYISASKRMYFQAIFLCILLSIFPADRMHDRVH